jgi:hypothetical protein
MSFERQVDILVASVTGIVVFVGTVFYWGVSVSAALAFAGVAFAAVLFFGRQIARQMLDSLR